jgi:hypothetical protein
MPDAAFRYLLRPPESIIYLGINGLERIAVIYQPSGPQDAQTAVSSGLMD